ncbi:MAG TPA: redoxin domain-containing protein [Mucilaginibacter sp.]|nr:redoxin domain-containing protein [Mucilaginibacter sp.]
MLALVKSPKYPAFDNLELEHEQEFSFRPWQALKPVTTGDTAPDFIFEKDSYRWQHFHNGMEGYPTVPLRQLFNKTLVLTFYSSAWQEHGLDMLNQLSAIQQEFGTNDANLLVIHAEKGRRLEKLAWDNGLTLSFYLDAENNIAEKFGIYSENDPVWNRFSGIDNNVPLLAAYVIAPHGRILYDYIESDFSGRIPSENIVLALRLQDFNK